MIARGFRPRSGITLTEILIAILIMGVGLISLATLFPLGLLRLREASRYSRAGLAFQTAADDMDTRSLFLKPTFTRTWYWTTVNKNAVPRDPFVQDISSTGSIGDGSVKNGVIASGSLQIPANNVGLTDGLPFCYDPLWRALTNVMPNTGVYDTANLVPATGFTTNQARFGDAILGQTTPPYITAKDSDGNLPSAYGLQRLTNFIPLAAASGAQAFPFTSSNFNPQLDAAGNVFTSIDDIVFNAIGGNATAPSSVLPDMSAGGPVADYKYTWFVTGRQTDAGGNGTQFVGEVVVCDGRPFGFDALPGTTVRAPAGESVYEAIFGVGAHSTLVPSGGPGFAVSDKSVLLLWPSGQPDPVLRAGGWICDVTYEVNTSTYLSRLGSSFTSFARCNWYQITKRTDPQTSVVKSGYRQMGLTVATPIKTKTLLNSDGSPVFVNVALVMPSVINVFPRSFEVHY